MNREIERKFLVKDKSFMSSEEITNIITINQGYLSKVDGKIVRVRTVNHFNDMPTMNKGVVTIKLKSPTDHEVGIDEYEWKIPYMDAVGMLQHCDKPIITKTRYVISHKKTRWEVDVFGGHKEGLIVAEAEVKNINAHIDIPEWIGEEVTGRPEYSNANM